MIRGQAIAARPPSPRNFATYAAQRRYKYATPLPRSGAMYGQPQYGQPQYAQQQQPVYGGQPQYGAPPPQQYAQQPAYPPPPQYGQPQYAQQQPQYGQQPAYPPQPQYGQVRPAFLRAAAPCANAPAPQAPMAQPQPAYYPPAPAPHAPAPVLDSAAYATLSFLTQTPGARATTRICRCRVTPSAARPRCVRVGTDAAVRRGRASGAAEREHGRCGGAHAWHRPYPALTRAAQTSPPPPLGWTATGRATGTRSSRALQASTR